MDCPKCGGRLTPAGTVTVDGADAFAVFQCETCTVKATLMGLEIDVAYSIGVAPDGSICDLLNGKKVSQEGS